MHAGTGFKNAAAMAALMFALCPAAQAQDEGDDGWIAGYVASGRAPGITRPKNQERLIDFEILASIAGKRARFELSDGRERMGVVERVEGDTVFLRAHYVSGFFRYSLARRDIRAIRLD